MAWLTLWLKKIILLVLLAAFLDLILPNTNLQRYVKMVMGLIILITILSPLFSLFHLSTEELALRLSRYQDSLTASTPDKEWREITDKLLSQQNQQMTEYVQNQVAAMVRQQVQSTYGVAADVDVKIRTADGQQPQIEAIALTLESPSENGRPGAESGSVRIDPVKPVRIQVGGGTDAREAVPVNGGTEPPLYREIAQRVARDWNLHPEQVRVVGETEAGNRQ